MAANMIGVRKNIIIVDVGFMPMVMVNPKICSRRNPFETEESCLSLSGTRKTTRFREIEVEYEDIHFKEHR
jgi:peptide deformylase